MSICLVLFSSFSSLTRFCLVDDAIIVVRLSIAIFRRMGAIALTLSCLSSVSMRLERDTKCGEGDACINGDRVNAIDLIFREFLCFCLVVYDCSSRIMQIKC